MCEAARRGDDKALDVDMGDRNDGGTMVALYINDIPEKAPAIWNIINDYENAVAAPANYSKYNRFRRSKSGGLKRDKELIIEELFELDNEESLNRLHAIDKRAGYKSL